LGTKTKTILTVKLTAQKAVCTLEETYGFSIDNGEKPVVKGEQEDVLFSVSKCNPNREKLTLKGVIFDFWVHIYFH
jgi:hypothetical protein